MTHESEIVVPRVHNWAEKLDAVLIVLHRKDQELPRLPEGAIAVTCAAETDSVTRAAMGLQQVATKFAIYSPGPIASKIEHRYRGDGRAREALGKVDRVVAADDSLLPDVAQAPPSFYIDLQKYSALRGFAPLTDLESALENFSIRCEFMGWRSSMEDSVATIEAAQPRSAVTTNWSIDPYVPPEKVNLISNIPRWKERPYSAKPLVSVSIATFNRAEYLREAIQTVLAQTFQDFEIVVVDDGSEDNTAEVVAEFHDERIRYTRIENSGIAAARNHATSISQGFFTAVHDSDDLMLPDRLERGLRALHNDVSASYGAWVNFDDRTGDMVMHVTKEGFDRNIVANNGQTPGHPTWLVPTNLLRTLKYDDRLTSAVDHNVAVRSALIGVKWIHVGGALIMRRIHDGQISETDSGYQKIGAQLTRQFAIDGMSSREEASATKRGVERGWPVIPEKKNLHHFFDRYLPDRMSERVVEVVGPIASKIGILTGFQSPIGVTAELDSSGAVRTERAWVHQPRWADLARLATAGYPYTLRSATHESNTDHKVESWVRGRLRTTVSKVKGSVWSFGVAGLNDYAPDDSSIGYYYKLESQAEVKIFGRRVNNHSEVVTYFSKFAVKDRFLVGASDIGDERLLELLGVEVHV
ncbi:glycosyltransferase family 2 protein [Brevibacterium casei]|uniref:glycosyltransferase family 2 protein n=1 Tax=Brevibacterium casei TaxID=33889 RepID=UPI001643B5B9|nr:glycosyltransferase family A protein [Brevibacterium casei]MCT2183972.1 glycosyltransferase family 2 protein [Brevibacterium casei]